jgi:hypothetical protein
MSRNIVHPETAERNRTVGLPGGYTFNSYTPDDYEGITLSFGCVRIGDHAHILVESGRVLRIVAGDSCPTARTGGAGKLVLRWHEWLVLREVLDADPRIRIAEIEKPTTKMAARHAGGKQ